MSNKIRIVNAKQCAFYMLNGVEPLQLEVDKNTKRLVFVFDAESTKPFWEIWKTGTVVI